MPHRPPSWASLLLAGCAWLGWTGLAHADTPMPYYSAAQVMQSLYGLHLPAQAQAFAQAADHLAATLPAHCTNQPAQAQAQWQRTLQAWASVSTPAIGPLLSRRSQRQIDFWPTRPELIDKALAKAPRTLADLETTGTPAKGLPALEHLLASVRAPTPAARQAAACAYAALLAQDVAAEAHALVTDLAPWAQRDWGDDPEATGTAMAEWVNQWLAGLEKLRWAHIEKPLRSAPAGHAPAWVRQDPTSNLVEWRAQWRSLRAQAALTPEQRQHPPLAGQGLIPIEAVLLGKGRVVLAQRWRQALDQVNTGFERLTPTASPATLLALAQSLKTTSLLFQNEVAPALDIPLGFSDADGD